MRSNFSQTRRALLKGSLLCGAFISFPLISTANIARKPSADGLITINNDGKIHIHSGGGQMNLYGEVEAIDVVSRILKCSPKLCVIENGGNPDHLAGLLGQYSNHLSFTSKKTNQRTAELLVTKLRSLAAVYFGGNIDNYDVKNGGVFGYGRYYSFEQIASFGRQKLSFGKISIETEKFIQNLKDNSITISVQEVY